jgi:hypothetical protein
MKHPVFATLLAATILALALPAFGADQVNASDDSLAHFVLSGGLTYGGDSLETIQYQNGPSVDIKAGGLVELGAGLLIQARDLPLAFQFTANYQWDSAVAKNGTATFSRVPFEATAFYTGIESWRFGGGVRYVTSIKQRGDENLGGSDFDFKNAFGELVEVGYSPTSHLWISGRYVFERYKLNSVNGISVNSLGFTPSVNANHFGIFATGVF